MMAQIKTSLARNVTFGVEAYGNALRNMHQQFYLPTLVVFRYAEKGLPILLTTQRCTF
jgi:hypothetical protein